jgi:hypothetical protein
VRQPIAAGAAVGLLNGRRAAAAAGAAVSGGGLQLAAGDTATAAAAAPSAVAFWGIDGVEAVSDLIKWLEYDVLVRLDCARSLLHDRRFSKDSI